MTSILKKYTEAVKNTDPIKYTGTVTRVSGMLIESSGPHVGIGGICRIIFSYPVPEQESDSAFTHGPFTGNNSVLAEVIGLNGGIVQMMPFRRTEGIEVGCKVVSLGESLSVPYENLVQTFYDKETSIYTVFGNSETEIGDYIATLTLTDTNNFVWQDDTTEPKEITWRIISGDVPTYADFAIDDGDEVYTGHPIEKNVICHRDGWNEGEHYTVTHTDNQNAGTPVLDFVNEGFTSNEDDGTFELRPYLSDETGLSDLVWTSSDESVATVDENGVVTLRGLGTATISATLPGSDNWNGVSDSYELTVNETQTEIVVVPGPGGSGGSGDGGVIYIPTVIREDAGISDMTWLIILACVVVVMLALIWLLWNRRTEGDGA